MPMDPTIIFYRYEESPFAFKLEYLLTVRKIPHYTVIVPPMPPRQDLLLLGINYRRVPVLAINDTVYVDTFKIAEVLESLYPHSSEHPTLFPKSLSFHSPQNAILQNLLVQFWTDRPLFKLAAALLPWDKLPKAFIEDREAMLGTKIDVNQIKQIKPYTISQLKIHLNYIEQLLIQSSTGFIMETEYPAFLDVSVYFILRWIQDLGVSDELYGAETDSSFKSIKKWMKSMKDFHEDQKQYATASRISGEEANKKIAEPPKHNENLEPKTQDEKLFGLGNQVAVVPDDSGKVPTVGKLVEITPASIAIIVGRRDGTGRDCRVCFPRLGFNVLPANLETSKM